MATLQGSAVSDTEYVPQQWSERRTILRDQIGAEDDDVAQGRVFWLPAEEELPSQAVKRACGKGAVEDVYGRPVVVISRPADDRRTAHFQLISSLHGKALGKDNYKRSNKFHDSRRTWYLPIAPSPDHPDAISNNAKKRFPTLELKHGARLRWDSYVNIRNVYKIDWTLLKVYTNPETPNATLFHFDRISTMRLLARGTNLTKYEPGPQYRKHPPRSSKRANAESKSESSKGEIQRLTPEPIQVSTEIVQNVQERPFLDPDTCSAISYVYSGMSTTPQSDFQMPEIEADCRSSPPWKVPPDTGVSSMAQGSVAWTAWPPLDRMLRHVAAGFEGKPKPSRNRPVKRPRSQFWVNAKGMMAVAIASV
ncbi:hypothetical protein DDE82_000605 [Stemphylium lycopersici]|uniref:Uncharacterized protein n=1 Tax=Stemphylium lycopersici TaxID=183478 RepID=A0A364NBZ5_STELY|nr:hypothetical protein DDE82_000605 [Stemphylium lycopersici]RAR14835.1 hypothetical protein DDE83_001867 [Stemphylium lycopersici]